MCTIHLVSHSKNKSVPIVKPVFLLITPVFSEVKSNKKICSPMREDTTWCQEFMKNYRPSSGNYWTECIPYSLYIHRLKFFCFCSQCWDHQASWGAIATWVVDNTVFALELLMWENWSRTSLSFSSSCYLAMQWMNFSNHLPLCVNSKHSVVFWDVAGDICYR